MTAPLISVLMPAYNHQAYVGAAIASVLGQSHARLELIVVDDASSDATWEIVSACGDERLRAVRHDTNQGAHASLNEAMSMARGDYLAILNSDDIHAPKRLERLLAAAQAGAGLVFSDVEFIDAQGTVVADHERAADYRSLSDTCARLAPRHWFLAGNPAISSSNFFVARGLAEQIGGFAPLRYTHDWDWALRAARHAEPIWLREPLLGYRVHAANTLSEDDAWRHIHENSYVQAQALIAWDWRGEPEAEAGAVLRALLGNRSCHPLALLAYLLECQAGVPEARLEALTVGAGGDWWLRRAAADSACPEALFRGLAWLAEREAVVAGQVALIEARAESIAAMSREIAARDAAIVGQAALVEERFSTIQRMDGEIANRDREIVGLQHIVADRDCLLAVRDATIADQARLIDERWAAMQDMGREIADRDADLGRERARLAECEAELERLRAHPCVRLGRYLRRLASGRR
jgi:GT2 family glycosyltransferase